MRDTLRSRGVYVPRKRNVLFGDALFAVVQDDALWPAIELSDSFESTTANTNNYEDKQKNKEPEANSDKAFDSELSFSAIISKDVNLSNLFKAYCFNVERYGGTTTDKFYKKCSGPRALRTSRRFRQWLLPCILDYADWKCPSISLDVLRPRNFSLDELLMLTEDRFKTPERVRALLRKWLFLSLTVIMSSNMDRLHSDWKYFWQNCPTSKRLFLMSIVAIQSYVRNYWILFEAFPTVGLPTTSPALPDKVLARTPKHLLQRWKPQQINLLQGKHLMWFKSIYNTSAARRIVA